MTMMLDTDIDYDGIAAHGGDGADVHPLTPRQRIHAAGERAAQLRADAWGVLRDGRGLITLRTAQLITDREIRILRLRDAVELEWAADTADELLDSIERLAAERMTRG